MGSRNYWVSTSGIPLTCIFRFQKQQTFFNPPSPPRRVLCVSRCTTGKIYVKKQILDFFPCAVFLCTPLCPIVCVSRCMYDRTT